MFSRVMFRSVMFVVVSLVSQLAFAFNFTQVITEQEIQERVSASMPIEKTRFFVTVKVSDPVIDLIKDTDEIGILANIDASAPGGIGGRGKVMIKGTLDYNSSKGEFYFKNPKIVRLDIENVPAEFMPNIQGLAQTALSNALSRYPVYKFKDNDVKHSLAKSVLKSLKVDNEQLVITLSPF